MHPYFGPHCEKKKKEAENRGIGYAKLVLKNHDFGTLKKRQLDHLELFDYSRNTMG